MKHSIAALGFLLTAGFTLPAIASESFTLNIPPRFNASQETGEVRITLALDAPPAAAQLVVNGTALNLGDTATVAGDSVSFTTGVGNEVHITYQPLTNFAGDFCQGGGAVEKNIPMRFAGAQDVIEYRVTTYLVAAPAFDCTKASKRTGDSPASLVPVDDGVAPALLATNRGRHPLDVVLVLDKSGSMASLPPDAASGATKVEILKSALSAFLAAWREIDQPTAGGGEWSQDRIGVVFFSSSPQAQSIPGAEPPANFFVPRGTEAPGPTHLWNAVSNNVGTLTPGGATSIGGGINTAMTQWLADPAHDLMLIVVTDGIQNTSPLIQPAVSGNLALPPIGTLPDELAKRFIPIQTIAFGLPDTVDENLLRDVALQTSGVSYISVSSNTFFDVFGSTLVAILKGNTVSLAIRRHATMSGTGPGAPQSVPVDKSAQRVVYALQWAPPLSDALDLEVLRPDGTAAVLTSGEKTPQAVLQTFDIGPADPGTWSVRVKRNGDGRDVPYTLNVFILEKDLDYRISSDTVRARTGESIRLRATVALDGKPLTKLPAGAIRVRIQRPGEGLGTILHDTRVETSGPTTTPTGDITTPYQRKLAQLTGPALLEKIVAKDVATIDMTGEGHGVYGATFDQTTVPGTYGFEVVLDWDDPRTGHVHREERLEQRVAITPDPTMTSLTTSRVADNTHQVSVTPRDRFGSYLGPGYGSRVIATINGPGTLVERVDRDETGTYVFTIAGIPAGTIPDVDISVDGVDVGNPSHAPAPTSHASRLFIDAGPNFAHGSLSINAGIERLLSPAWSVEGILGYHSRDVDDVWQLSLGGKRYFGASPLRPFMSGAVGAYRLDSGSTKAGGSFGAGVLYEWSSTCAVEGAWNVHNVDGDTFSAAEIGIRFAF